MSTKMQKYIDEAEQALLHTYNRYQVVFDKGEGVYLYDTDGKKYLDFVSGIAVFALGYHNEAYNNALKNQIDKIIHTSNYYYNVPAVEAAKKLKEISGMDRVFFTNSGAEAVEGAIKTARKYAYIPVKKRTGTLKSWFSAFQVHVNIIPCPLPGKPAIIACPQQIGQYLQQLFL